MKVRFKYGEQDFSFREGDNIRVVLKSELYCRAGEQPLSYAGGLLEIEGDNSGVWLLLPDEPEQKNFFAFEELETIEVAAFVVKSPDFELEDTEQGKEGQEPQYETRQQAEQAAEQLQQAFPFATFVVEMK